MNNLRILTLYEYLKSACEAEYFENNQQRYQRIVQQIVNQYATNKSKLTQEINDFCKMIIEELDNTNSWYFLDQNLRTYVKYWQNDKIMKED